MGALSPQLLSVLFELVHELPPATISAVAAELESTTGLRDRRRLTRFGGSQGAKNRLGTLVEVLTTTPELEGKSVATALLASLYVSARQSAENHLEIAWTGPGTEAVPLRRVDQVLYQLIEEAQSELVLSSFVTYRADRALEALLSATNRSVRVTLVLELAKQSGGKVKFDELSAISAQIPRAEIFYWPVDRRLRNEVGGYGIMHAKCLVVDRTAALVSSANLTDNALEMNMELGLMVRGTVATRLAEHFEQLIARGELRAVADR